MTIPPFAHVAAASHLVPAVSGAWYWKRMPRPLRVFAIFSWYALIHLTVEYILGRAGRSNQWLIDLQQIAELLVLLWLFGTASTHRAFKTALLIGAACYTVLWIYVESVAAEPDRFTEATSVASMLILIAASVFTFHALVRRDGERPSDHAVYWIALGVLIYGAGTIVVTTFSNDFLAMGMDTFVAMWHINWGFTIVTNLLYARSFQCRLL